MKKIIVMAMIAVTLLMGFSAVYASNGATEVVEASSKKDREIASYVDKYNDNTYGLVAYYLHVAQKYSIPICFVGLSIGALNFFIIGNKKLDKKEEGFGWIVAFLLGLVVFQVLPLIFALIFVSR